MNNMEVCALCPTHMKSYQKHVDWCACSLPECGRLGSDLPTRSGRKRFRTEHAKKLILSDNLSENRSKSPPLSRGWSSKGPSKYEKEESNSHDSDMPALEPITAKVELGKWPDHSESVSTGSINSSCTCKLKEIVGRFATETEIERNTHKKEHEHLSRGGGSDHSSSGEHSNNKHVSRPQARTTKLGKRTKKQKKSHSSRSFSPPSDSFERKSRRSLSPSNSTRCSSEPGPSSRSPSSSSPPRHWEKNRKRSRSKRHGAKQSPPFQSLLPKGLCRAKIRSTRHTVRGRDELGARLQPRGKYASIADHLGAVADREGKKACGFCKVDQVVVGALRGFGLRKTTLGTGTYGAELEQ